jgi:putative membrane protein insertion efficiency factor
MRKVIIFFIHIYQKTLSPDHGFLKKIGLTTKQVCVFYPTCSEYMEQAVEKYGAVKGFWLGTRRILRCHPWQKNHFDPLL